MHNEVNLTAAAPNRIKERMKETTEVFEVNLNRKKMLWLVLGSVIITVFSIWFYLSINTGSITVNLLCKTIAAIACLLFGISTAYGIDKLRDEKPALVVDAEGIKDNSSAIAVNLIKWKEIYEVKVMIIRQTKLLLIFVDHPQQFLEREKNILKRVLMMINYSIFKTPVTISASSLDYNFIKLARIIASMAKNNN
jgi:hypothetical protein